MRIAVEASAIVESGRTGVGVVASQLVEAAARALPDSAFDLVHFFSVRRRDRPPLPEALTAPNVGDAPVRWFSGRVYQRLLLSGLAPPGDLLAGGRPDVFFFPNFAAWPLTRRCRPVVLVHDLAFRRTPQYVRERTRRELDALVPRSLRDAHVVAVSESTARDVAAEFGVPASRLHVVPNGVDHARFRPRTAAEAAAVAERLGLPPAYVLYVGTLEPRKNVDGLLRAFRALPADVRRAHPLVLAGGKGWLDDAIEATLAEVSREAPVVRLGRVRDADLPALYSGASAFAYPSHLEGFGLPVLEAMACGAPVVTSSTSSLPEVGGDAALYADPADDGAIAARLLELLTDPALAARCREAGLARAAGFRWEESGRRLAGVFRLAAGEGRPAGPSAGADGTL